MSSRITVRAEKPKEEYYLTPLELEIIRAIAAGSTSREIAAERGISFKTVEVHRHQVLKRLKCKNMPHLVAVLYEEKILKKKRKRICKSS